MASELIQSFTSHIQPQVPGYTVKHKTESRLMKFLNKILFFTPNFMTRFTTTCNNTVYVTDDLWEDNSMWALSTLAHEAQHIYDKQRWSAIFFGFAYLLPQILAPLTLLSLLAIWFSNAWLWSLAALALLAPIPAYFRMIIERRGYLMSLCVIGWTFGEEYARTQIPWVVKSFTSSSYYFMWPFKKSLTRWFEKTLPPVWRNPAKHNAIFVLVFDYVTQHRVSLGGKIK